MTPPGDQMSALEHPTLEDVEEAVVEGLQPDGGGEALPRGHRPGSARSAFSHRAFTEVWLGTMGSNIGTWMQNVALSVLAFKLTHSASFVGLITFTQLGPILLLSNFGGLLADTIDRRKLLIICNLEQLVFSVALAVVCWGDHPSRAWLLLVTLAIGVGNAIQGPSLSAFLPGLVPKQDLPGAVSMFAVQMNLSRVIGPAIGGAVIASIHASGVFLFNAVTYLSAVVVIARAPEVKALPPKPGDPQGWRRLTAGFAIARRDPVVRNVLIAITTFSLVCLPFIGLMTVLAERDLHIDSKSTAYGLLYACFGLGAALGAMSVGTIFVGADRQRLYRGSMGLFAVLLAVWGLLRHAAPAYPVIIALGAVYFCSTTTLSTTLQAHLDDAVRGRVMALYMMGFGGTVPLGALIGGVLADRFGISWVICGGAAFAAVLALVLRIEARPSTRRVRLAEPARA